MSISLQDEARRVSEAQELMAKSPIEYKLTLFQSINK